MSSIRDYLPGSSFGRMEVYRELVRQFEADAGAPIYLRSSGTAAAPISPKRGADGTTSSDIHHDDLGEWLVARPKESLLEQNASSGLVRWLASSPPEQETLRVPYPDEDDEPAR